MTVQMDVLMEFASLWFVVMVCVREQKIVPPVPMIVVPVIQNIAVMVTAVLVKLVHHVN